VYGIHLSERNIISIIRNGEQILGGNVEGEIKYDTSSEETFLLGLLRYTQNLTSSSLKR
jgi:hypothetical protein